MQSNHDLSIHTAFSVVVSESEVVSEGLRMERLTPAERFFEMCRKGSAFFSNERSSTHGWTIGKDGFASRIVECSGSHFRKFGYHMKESDAIWHVHNYLVIPGLEIPE